MSSTTEPNDEGLYNTKGWENPFSPGTFLHETYEEVVTEERDLIIIVDDILGRRGTGKTVSCLQLARCMDQTEEGVITEKTTLQPEELRNAYTTHPHRSGLVFDEAEFGASNRDAMTLTNKALREIMSMGRVEQKYVIMNAPIKDFIDRDLQKLADVWITIVRKGLGLVHQLKWEPYSRQLLTPKKQWLNFNDIERGTPLRDTYNALTKEKRARISGEEGDAFITEAEHKKRLKKALQKAEKDKRNEVIKRIVNGPGFDDSNYKQKYLAEALDMSEPHLSRIARGVA